MERQPRLSPDGGWIAYSSRESGREEVYVRPFPNTQVARAQVSVNGGFAPLWSRNGKELFYVELAAGMLVATKVETTPTFQVRERAPLFNATGFFLQSGRLGPVFDVSPDGQRFIMSRNRESATEHLVLVQNWTAGLAEPGKR